MRREFGCPQISQINKENRMRELCLNFLFSRLKKICANGAEGIRGQQLLCVLRVLYGE